MTFSPDNLLITGACGGLGSAVARQALARGARVVLVGLNAGLLDFRAL